MDSSTSFDLQNSFIFLLILSIFLIIFNKYKNSPKRSSSLVHLPPSPPSLPIIGHLHHILSTPLSQSLHTLSSKYGPFLYLRAFNLPVLLVSSSSAAYDFYRANDLNFSSRYQCVIDNSFVAGPFGFLTAPYGDYWRFMKKLVVSKLLGQQHLERSRGIRGEELERFYVSLLDKAKRNEVVQVREEMMKFTNNNICRMAMGTRCSEEDGEAEKIKDLITETTELTKKLLVAILLRGLKRFGISFFEKDVLDVSRRYDELLEKILREHEENPNREHKDMMDDVLEAYHDENAEYKISRDQIKAFFVELFFAGTDTSSQATQWTMAELINHPLVFKRLREEIDCVVGKTRLLRETDLPNLPYLQAVVKEGLRMHPPAAAMLKKCDQGCKIGGFDIPKDTLLVTNFYSMMRDPDVWENPNEFRPERFLVSRGKGQEVDRDEALKYIPFGAGRRACPGANLGYVLIETAIGTMVQCFDWKIEGDKVNMEEAGHMSLNMAYPLKSTPVLHFNTFIELHH